MLLGIYRYKYIILVDQPPVEPSLTQIIEVGYQQNLKIYNNWKLVNDITKSFVLIGLNKSLCMSFFNIMRMKENLGKLESNFGKKSESHMNNH